MDRARWHIENVLEGLYSKDKKFFLSFFLSFLFLLPVPTDCRCGGLHLITLSDKQTVGRTPLDSELANRRGLYLTEHIIHVRESQAAGEIRIHNLSKLAAGEPRLRLRGHWDRQTQNSGFKILNFLDFYLKDLMEKISTNSRE